MTDQEPSDQAELAEPLSKNETLLLERKIEIFEALENTFDQNPKGISNFDILAPIMAIFNIDLDEEENFRVSRALINLIAKRPEDIHNKLENVDVSEGLYMFFVRLSINFSFDIQRVRQYRSQGDNYWSYFDTTIKITDDATATEHHIVIDRKESISFSSNPNSDLIIIDDLLNTQLRITEEADPEEIEQRYNLELLAEIQDNVEQIISKFEQGDRELPKIEDDDDKTKGG
jgi:hypothetical protein